MVSLSIASVWDVGISALVLLLTLRLVFRESRTVRGLVWVLVVPAAVAAAAAWTPDGSSSWKAALPQPDQAAEFVSSKSCRSCHPGYYDSWHRSYHRSMTQAATPEAVLPDWNNVRLASRGRSYRLFRKGDEFWANMVDPAAEVQAIMRGVELTDLGEPPRATRRIVMTTGSHRHQTYWVQNPNGTLVQFPWVYHIKDHRWVFRIDSFLRPPIQQKNFNIWNISCIECHATGGQPRVDPQAHTMLSAAELGIACEACHGPGEEHVRANRSPLRRLKQHQSGGADPTIVNPRKLSAETSAKVCGHCHSFSEPKNQNQWTRTGNLYRAGEDDLEVSRRLFRYEDLPEAPQTAPESSLRGRFWPDGTVRTGGREYNGLIETPCYTQGTGSRKMSCLSCHSMHGYISSDDQLAPGMDGNRACTQCHSESKYTQAVERHTHHPASSAGSLCYNCHMPHTTYALFKAIRSHRVESPSVRTSVRVGRPNGCNLCHLDKTLRWTAEHVESWYSVDEPVALDDEQETIAASVLWLLRGNAAQRAIIAWNMGRKPARDASGDDWLAPFLAYALDDSYSAVRNIAYHSLRTLPGFAGFEYEFDGPPDHRAKAKQRALEQWSARHRESRRRNVSAVPLRKDGGLQQSTVDRLLHEQDQTPLVIIE